MSQPTAGEIAAQLAAEVRALPVCDAKHARAVRRKYSRQLRGESGDFVLDVGRHVVLSEGERWLGCEIILFHRDAIKLVGEKELEELGAGIDSWGSVDAFARLLSGPVWLRGQVDDCLIHRWARSENRWRRRAALVSTVALNVRSQGGMGDAPRTLGVCEVLAADRDDMVVKALSWALRALVVHYPGAVRAFLAEHDPVLAARVKREVCNKLETGLKNPRRRRAAQD
jgi:3-methyladenine DNA glycosylase AlkD